VLCIRR